MRDEGRKKKKKKKEIRASLSRSDTNITFTRSSSSGTLQKNVSGAASSIVYYLFTWTKGNKLSEQNLLLCDLSFKYLVV